MAVFTKIICNFPVSKPLGSFHGGGRFEQGFIMLNEEEAFASSESLLLAKRLLLQSDPVGRIGRYQGVYELSASIECYTPGDGSNPGEGIIGVEEMMRAISFTTYCHAEHDASLQKFITNLQDIHPWEQPVIQLLSNVVLLNVDM